MGNLIKCFLKIAINGVKLSIWPPLSKYFVFILQDRNLQRIAKNFTVDYAMQRDEQHHCAKFGANPFP